MTVAICLSAGVTSACAEDSTGLFPDMERALTFTQSFGAEWRDPAPLKDSGGYYLGFSKPAFFVYSLGTLKGYVGIAYDDTGRIGLYEVRFPVVDKKCVGVPNTRVLAKSLLKSFEPNFANDVREVNRVGSSADLVWPYTAFPSGPGAIVGHTAFTFYKMNGYCSFRIFRIKDPSKLR
ncbi:hypothetical protein FJQ54_09640 [Sandaracinobacter neustonicus]|uniref:Uncharacterized protein n=1 Tax=Sandaracinobacter neustonicus TaxID=1715348 RepID=A0A501XKR7_9SPHN|nr:hypothetical protein [Sandaracinobacter neustonicus]TPE61146.1 hypothetical protein FJQ54_09640 [Sandaracinobacter neustonicus]